MLTIVIIICKIKVLRVVLHDQTSIFHLHSQCKKKRSLFLQGVIDCSINASKFWMLNYTRDEALK